MVEMLSTDFKLLDTIPQEYIRLNVKEIIATLP